MGVPLTPRNSSKKRKLTRKKPRDRNTKTRYDFSNLSREELLDTANRKLIEYKKPTFEKPTLDPAEPPEFADAVNPVPEIQLPDNRPVFPDTSKVNSRSEFYNSYIESQERIADEAKKAREAQMASPEAQASQSFLQRLLNSKSPTEVRQESFDEIGFDPREYFTEQKARLKEIESLSKQLTSAIEAKDTQIAASYDKMASNNFINNQIAQIERNAAPKINSLSAAVNSKQALMEAASGNFQEAQQFVNQAVNDATADLNFNRQMWATFHDINQDKLDKLDSTYKEAVTNAWNAAEKDFEMAYEEKSQIGKLMLEYPNSGISMEDTLESAYEKARGGASADLAYSRRGDGTETDDDSPLSLLQSAIDAGMSPDEAALDIAAYYESVGVQVDDKMITAWRKQARQLTPTELNENAVEMTGGKSAYDIGKTTGKAFRGFIPQMSRGIENINRAADDFFSGLFGA